jgi:hypothetical protein
MNDLLRHMLNSLKSCGNFENLPPPLKGVHVNIAFKRYYVIYGSGAKVRRHFFFASSFCTLSKIASMSSVIFGSRIRLMSISSRIHTNALRTAIGFLGRIAACSM